MTNREKAEAVIGEFVHILPPAVVPDIRLCIEQALAQSELDALERAAGCVAAMAKRYWNAGLIVESDACTEAVVEIRALKAGGTDG